MTILNKYFAQNGCFIVPYINDTFHFQAKKTNNRELFNKLLEEEIKIDKWCNEKYVRVQLLHQYNNIKDATQIVINHIANIEGTTVTEVHQRLNLME